MVQSSGDWISRQSVFLRFHAPSFVVFFLRMAAPPSTSRWRQAKGSRLWRWRTVRHPAIKTRDLLQNTDSLDLELFSQICWERFLWIFAIGLFFAVFWILAYHLRVFVVGHPFHLLVFKVPSWGRKFSTTSSQNWAVCSTWMSKFDFWWARCWKRTLQTWELRQPSSSKNLVRRSGG